MKKTIITLLSLAGVASANTNGFILTHLSEGVEGAPQEVTGLTTFYDFQVGVAGTTSTSKDLGSLTDGTSINFTVSRGITATSNKVDWTNNAALTSVQSDLGLDNLSLALRAYASSGGYSQNTVTLDFTNSKLDGNDITLYVLMSSRLNKLSSVTFTGLTDATYNYAVYNGSGYELENDGNLTDNGVASLDEGAAMDYLTLVKVTGTLTDANTVTITSGGNKGAFAMVAYKAIPEPTTATLSLLALAGFAARRRRK